MDLHDTPEDAAFRFALRQELQAALPEALARKVRNGHIPERADIVGWQRILNAKGLAVPDWPVAWGGASWSPVQLHIWREEIALLPAPPPLIFNVAMIGPVLAEFGSTAQQRRFLPRIANLDDWWCQGFSEPEAGSDLAALRTRAVREGDSYLVTGTKSWTSFAHLADWMFCLVRTDPAARPQSGLSFLLIEMNSPGIGVREIETIDGWHCVNEVNLDQVRVPVENRVGEENKGWEYANFLLANERAGLAGAGMCKAQLRRLRELAAIIETEGGKLIELSRFREKLAALEVQTKTLEMLQARRLFAESRDAAMLAPILKIRGSELLQAIHELTLDAAGPLGLPFESGNTISIGPEWAASIAPGYFHSRALTIYGGSSEIQKNLIARSILGL